VPAAAWHDRRSHGNVLALDCETYEVRARITVPRDARKDGAEVPALLARRARDAN
jgi:hypothetical protein